MEENLCGKFVMQTKLKSGTYTATPASLYLPLAPYPTALKRPPDKDAPLEFREAQSAVTSIDEARVRAQELLKECKRRFNNNDPTGIAVLLGEHPMLINDPWVWKTFFQLVRAGRFRYSRGRRRGTFRHHPLILFGLVQAAIKRGEAANPEQAFHLLAELEWCPYDTAKKLYYQVRNEPRFQAEFVLQTDKTRPASNAEMEYVATAETLRPGAAVIQRFHHPVLGPGQFTLSAVDDSDNT